LVRLRAHCVVVAIVQLRKRSKAWDAGLEEGDALVSINDHPCHNISHAAAMNLVDKAGHYLNLKVIRSVSWSVGQSVSQSVSQSINQSVNQSASQSVT